MTVSRTQARLYESAPLLKEASRDDGSFKVRLIDEGMGSSGYYPRETLEKYHNAFDDVLSFAAHPKWDEEAANRDFRNIAGRILGETWTEEDRTGKLGVYGYYLPDPNYLEQLERYRDKLALSIYISGEGHINDDGDFEVDFLNGLDPLRSVDVVQAGGRGGKLSLESLKEFYNVDPTTEGRTNRKETTMDLETLATKLDALTTTVLALASDKEAEASESAQAKADDEAVAKAVESYAAKVEAIAKAELPAVLAESLRKDALAGADVEVKITEAKALTEALKTELTESGAGRVIEGSDDDYTLKGFGGK